MKTVYLASGWFTPAQEKARLEMLNTISKDHFVFSPKDDNLGTEDSDFSSIFQANIREIENCDIMVASTIDKDMGTLFECGVAYAKGIPIVYYAPGLSGPFNLMLAESAVSVCTTQPSLHVASQLDFPAKQYSGEIE